MDNPFHFGRALDADELVDRKAEVEEILSTIRSRGRLFLIGPRRFGKTSVLAAAQARAEKAGAIVLRLNAQEFPSLEALAARLVAMAAERLTPKGKRIAGAFADVFKALRPRLVLEPDGSFSVALDASAPRGPEGIAQALHGVHALAERSKRSVGVMLDEFQEVVGGDEQAEAQLRSAIQTHRHLGYVFAGSDTRFLTRLVSDPGRPFYQSGARFFLGPLPREELRAFLLAGLARRARKVAPGVPELILDLAEDVPYNVQRLAHAVWEAAAGQVTEENVRRALSNVVAGEDPFHTHVWSALTSNQKTALVAVARRGGRDLFSGDVLLETRLQLSSMRSALDAMESKSILRRDTEKTEVLVRFEDPFFGHWVRRVILGR